MNSIEWYRAQFPESQFLVAEDNRTKYVDKVINGHIAAKQSKVLICGIVRNAEPILRHTIARIKMLGSFFEHYHVILYENDSQDNTKEILISTIDKHFWLMSENVNPPPFRDSHGIDRRRWMAKARNKYVEIARSYMKNNSVDYVIVLDTDLEGGWSYHGILNSLGHFNWDGIGSNSIYYRQHKGTWLRLFYDSWAYRELGHLESHDDHKVNLLKFNRGEPLKEVHSCFGGLAIYKPWCIQSAQYSEDDCDHPTFHTQLRQQGAKIYLNPSQITIYNRNEYVI